MRKDFNEAKSREFDLIPAGTICAVQMMIKPGGGGHDGWLTRSADGSSEFLSVEFIVVGGPYDKRKIFDRLLQVGTTEGQATAITIADTKLRGIVESAFGIDPNDTSDEAKSKRTVELWDAFQNLRFIARIGIEKSKDPAYPDKNRLYPISPAEKAWKTTEQIQNDPTLPLAPKPGESAAVPANAISRPRWAEPTAAKNEEKA